MLDQNIIKAIDKILNEKQSIIIAIDGMSGSGKTTLAVELKDKYNANLIHMDDYFLPLNMRSKERLATPGGNVNYEKFYNDIILNLNQDLISEPFDCKTKTFKEKTIINHNKVTIIEGSYSLHPYFKNYYDISIVLKIDPKLQVERLTNREKDKVQNFIDLWIPLENKYLNYYKIFDKATFLIDIKSA